MSPEELAQPAGETPAQQVETPQAETAPASDEFDKERAMATIEKLRGYEREAKKLEKRLAEFEAAEAKRKEAEMSDLEKAQQRAAELEAELQAERLKVMKRDAAAKHNLPAELATRLQGETLEELEEDAKKLAELLPKAGKANPISPTSPGQNATGKEAESQQRARVYGRDSGSLFDPEAITKSGGGVHWVNKE